MKGIMSLGIVADPTVQKTGYNKLTHQSYESEMVLKETLNLGMDWFMLTGKSGGAAAH